MGDHVSRRGFIAATTSAGVGLALAIFGGVLMFYGLLPRFGPLIIIALYLIGVLLTPRNKQMAVDWAK